MQPEQEPEDTAPKALPCPFCGSTDVECDASDDEDPSDVWVYCVECLCSGPVATIGCRDTDDEDEGDIDLEKEAVELWNKRVAPLQELRQ